MDICMEQFIKIKAMKKDGIQIELNVPYEINDQNLLSPKYTTEKIGIKFNASKSSVQKWAEQNDVPFVNQGKRKYYIWTELSVEQFNKRKKRNKYVDHRKEQIYQISNGTEVEINFYNSYTTKALAHILGCSVRRVQNWCKKLDIPYIAFGKRKEYIIEQKVYEERIKGLFGRTENSYV
jgi:DNA-binding transcriptional regulator YiaG